MTLGESTPAVPGFDDIGQAPCLAFHDVFERLFSHNSLAYVFQIFPSLRGWVGRSFGNITTNEIFDTRMAHQVTGRGVRRYRKTVRSRYPPEMRTVSILTFSHYIFGFNCIHINELVIQYIEILLLLHAVSFYLTLSR